MDGFVTCGGSSIRVGSKTRGLFERTKINCRNGILDDDREVWLVCLCRCLDERLLDDRWWCWFEEAEEDIDETF